MPRREIIKNKDRFKELPNLLEIPMLRLIKKAKKDKGLRLALLDIALIKSVIELEKLNRIMLILDQGLKQSKGGYKNGSRQKVYN